MVGLHDKTLDFRVFLPESYRAGYIFSTPLPESRIDPCDSESESSESQSFELFWNLERFKSDSIYLCETVSLSYLQFEISFAMTRRIQTPSLSSCCTAILVLRDALTGKPRTSEDIHHIHHTDLEHCLYLA